MPIILLTSDGWILWKGIHIIRFCRTLLMDFMVVFLIYLTRCMKYAPIRMIFCYSILCFMLNKYKCSLIFSANVLLLLCTLFIMELCSIMFSTIFWGRKWANALFQKKKKKIWHFALIREMPLFWNTIFSKLSLKKKKIMETYSGVLRSL